MENTALAPTLHTSGCLKNESPLMWWLHGFNFCKKNAFPLCFFPLFYPYFLLFVAYIISFMFFSQGTDTKQPLNVIWTLSQLTLLFCFTTFWLFLLNPGQGGEW